MQGHIVKATIIFLLFALLTGSAAFASGAEQSVSPDNWDDFLSDAQRQLYESEWNTWREYIARFGDYRLDNSFDVTFYHIRIDITLEYEYISGEVACRFTSLQDGLSQIKLNLQDSLVVTGYGGNVGSFYRHDDTVYINLDRPYASGEGAEVTLTYEGDPPVIANTKGLRYDTHGSSEPIIASLSTPFLAHYWWPCKDGPGDKPDSVYIDITIPDTTINGLPLVAVSNGSLDSTAVSGGKKTFFWRERYPIVTYYVMVAVSNFEFFQDYYDGGPDEQYPFDYHCFHEDLSASMAGVEQMPQVAAFFSDLFGPYPFRDEKYGITELGFYGGIENQTNTIQNSMELDGFSTSVHEFSHMWFGDMITCLDWHHGWLNEGFATYSEALWVEHSSGTTAFREEMENYGNAIGSGTLYLQNISDPMQIFIGIIYYKGAWVLHMLRHVLGDEVFFDCMKTYASTPEFMYGHATTEDFRDVCETVSGLDLDYFFQQWVYGAAYPRYTISSHSRQRPGMTGPYYETFIHIEQYQASDPQVFTMPLDFRFWYGSGYTVLSGWNDARVQDIVINTSFMPDAVDFDPFNWVLDLHSTVDYTLHIITDSLSEGLPSQPYNDTIIVISASDQIEIAVIDGSLPDGYTLDPNTGIISGVTYSDTGLSTFTVRAADPYNPGYIEDKTLTLYIGAGGSGPGDANADGEVNVGDAVYLINYVFKYGPPPPYPNWADANADCQVNVGDAVYLINYIFNSGPAPKMGCVN